MPFVQEGSRLVLRQGAGPASYLFVPTLAVGVGLTLVGGKSVLQGLDVVRGVEAFATPVAAALLVGGVVLVLLAVLTFAGRSEIVVDAHARTVRTELRVGAPLRVRRFHFDDFDRVEVLRGAGRRSPGHGSGYTYYFAAMKGRRASIALERMSLREATAQAHDVARRLGVPVVPCRDP